MSKDRIVITGVGLVSPLGVGVENVWSRILRGETGIGPNTRIECDDLPVQIAALVPTSEEDEFGLDESAVVSTKDRKKVDRFTIYALAAAEEALRQADWTPETDEEQFRTGTVVATGIGGFPMITGAKTTLETKGVKRLSPFVVPAFLANLAAGNISMRYGLKGPIGCPVTACAASLQAVGDAMRMIKAGEADVVVAGGTDACVDRLSIAGFAAARALSTQNEDPSKASRPFDRDRDGFVLGEGAGIVVMERLDHALARGATPLVELTGYGTSADAHHLTAGPEDGSGAARAIKAAMMQAGDPVENYDYVNAHATSTPLGDRAEVAALRSIFGDNLPGMGISSTKSATGHLLGAAGGVATVLTTMALVKNTMPPTLNCDNPDEGFEDLDFIPNTPRERAIRSALCNAFGFGGVNASLTMKQFQA